MNFAELTAPVVDLADDFEGAIAAWKWLVRQPAAPLLITAMGDVFVHYENAIHLLDTARGSFERVADSREQWKRRLEDGATIFEWFRPDLVRDFTAAGLRLERGEVYSPKVPLVLGGSAAVDNYVTSQWRMHLHVLGHVHNQVQGLPPGTKVDVTFE